MTLWVTLYCPCPRAQWSHYCLLSGGFTSGTRAGARCWLGCPWFPSWPCAQLVIIIWQAEGTSPARPMPHESSGPPLRVPSPTASSVGPRGPTMLLVTAAPHGCSQEARVPRWMVSGPCIPQKPPHCMCGEDGVAPWVSGVTQPDFAPDRLGDWGEAPALL